MLLGAFYDAKKLYAIRRKGRERKYMEKITESFELYGKQYTLQTGELAKQASGAVVVTQGDTTVLVTSVISDQGKRLRLFPFDS